jgi:hypothetical protein
MPRLQLLSYSPYAPMPVREPGGRRLLIPRLQFQCLVRLPNTFLPRDGIIDTGSPFSWFPEGVWSQFQPGIDFEWLPFDTGFTPPRAQTVGWAFTFRMARMLNPITLFDIQTHLNRDQVIVQFADGNPPAPPGNKRPPCLVFGLWGGVIEGTSLHISTDAATGHSIGTLEW